MPEILEDAENGLSDGFRKTLFDLYQKLRRLDERVAGYDAGLAAVLVVPPERLSRVSADALREQFARTPYAVSFRRKVVTFILVTLHIRFGEVPADRIAELTEIADMFRVK